MSKREHRAESRNRLLHKIAAYLVKGFCQGLFGLAVIVVMMGCFGYPEHAWTLLSGLGPWLVRSAIAINCFLAITSISVAL
jgi:hypothetical protein